MDKKVCNECGREYKLTTETCPECGSALEVREVPDPENWVIIFHSLIKENVFEVQSNLSDYGISSEARLVNLSDFKISLRSMTTWAVVVRKEIVGEAIDKLHMAYGFEPARKDAEAVAARYPVLQEPAEKLAEKPNWPIIIEALRDPELPGPLIEKSISALIAAGNAAEEIVLQALIEELHQEHYTVRAHAVDPLTDALSEIGTQQTIERLLELCADPDSTTRLNAVHCIGLFGTIEHARNLLPLLEDEDEDVRQETNEALGTLTDDYVWEDLITTPEEGRKVRRRWEKLLKKLQ
ncbi:MAG TPA: HEAT repeat domain-containing protein [Planctomycetota bacterium]|nr:HEAT repeat domain-containing protein [Planctomycetota bacterium]